MCTFIIYCPPPKQTPHLSGFNCGSNHNIRCEAKLRNVIKLHTVNLTKHFYREPLQHFWYGIMLINSCQIINWITRKAWTKMTYSKNRYILLINDSFFIFFLIKCNLRTTCCFIYQYLNPIGVNINYLVKIYCLCEFGI